MATSAKTVAICRLLVVAASDPCVCISCIGTLIDRYFAKRKGDNYVLCCTLTGRGAKANNWGKREERRSGGVSKANRDEVSEVNKRRCRPSDTRTTSLVDR